MFGVWFVCVVLYLLWFGVYVDFEAFEGGGGDSEGFLKGGGGGGEGASST